MGLEKIWQDLHFIQIYNIIQRQLIDLHFIYLQLIENWIICSNVVLHLYSSGCGRGLGEGYDNCTVWAKNNKNLFSNVSK